MVIQQGEVLAGIVWKKHVGNTGGGLIHVTWKDLGPQSCCDLLSNIQLLVNNWLVTTGFTVGVQDIVAKPEITERVRARILHNKREVRKITKKAHDGKLTH